MFLTSAFLVVAMFAAVLVKREAGLEGGVKVKEADTTR